MPLQIVRNDITKMQVDAIVNAANNSLLGGGGVDGAIHRAAGPALLEECRRLGGCATGEAKLTGGYRLPSRYVIHTVGPVWSGGHRQEEALLTACYRNSLELAAAHGCQSVAFPLISSGAYGYPKADALRVAVETISQFLEKHEMEVSIVVFDRDAYSISEELYRDVKAFIDDTYVAQHPDRRSLMRKGETLFGNNLLPNIPPPPCASMALPMPDLESALRQVDEGFTEMLLRKIDERGMTDVECYKKANIDRKLFSKIRSDKHYHPKKVTVIAFALALELSLEETKEMLMKAGFSLTHSSKFDIIVEYFISKGNYNVFELNEVLFAFDQVLIGA